MSAGTTPKVHREELNGESKTNLSTELLNVIFLEFARSLRLEKMKLWVFDWMRSARRANNGCKHNENGRATKLLMKKKGEKPSLYIDDHHTDEELHEIYANGIKEPMYERVSLDLEHHLPR